MTDLEIKVELLAACELYLKSRRATVEKVLADVVVSLNSETKSSAGDKHETGRAMLQLERENSGKQLVQVEQLEHVFSKVPQQIFSGPVRLGSVVYTTHANYFLSIPAGVISVNATTYYALGVSSPIGQLLLGKNVGDQFCFRESKIKILKIT